VIQPLFHSASTWAKYKNPRYDEAVEQARATLDSAARLSWYRKALEIIREEVPGIGLYQDVAIYGARKRLRWKPAAGESFFVYDMRWE
jgi:peptide/nickel transport system substrate-binding protein